MGQHAPMHRGQLVLIIGPSGVGKSIILKSLRQAHPEFHFPRSATTRARRPGESDDLYRFVTEAEFDDLLARDAFIETAVVHGAARYGTLKEEILPAIEAGKTVIREVDVQGFDAIHRHPLFAERDAKYPLRSIFILPENREQLIARITQRAPISKEELDNRIASMDKELAYADGCSATVVNRDGRLEETIREVEGVIEGR